MFGIKIVREDGKTDWGSLRAVMYCLLAAWIIGVRLMNLDPFDDFMSGKITLATWIDLLCLYGVYLFCWHVMFPNRPKISI